MSPHDINDLCAEKMRQLKHELDKHVEASPEFRDKAIKAEAQILTLEKANVSIMEDIKIIKADLSTIKTSMESLIASVKIWVLGGICSSVVVFAIPVMGLVYQVGKTDKQVEINTKKWESYDNLRYSIPVHKD